MVAGWGDAAVRRWSSACGQTLEEVVAWCIQAGLPAPRCFPRDSTRSVNVPVMVLGTRTYSPDEVGPIGLLGRQTGARRSPGAQYHPSVLRPVIDQSLAAGWDFGPWAWDNSRCYTKRVLRNVAQTQIITWSLLRSKGAAIGGPRD